MAAPGALILAWDAYPAAIVVALPLSLAANMAAYFVAVLMLPSIDSNGAPIAAVMMSGAALVQLLAVRVLLHTWRHERAHERASSSQDGDSIVPLDDRRSQV